MSAETGSVCEEAVVDAFPAGLDTKAGPYIPEPLRLLGLVVAALATGLSLLGTMGGSHSL